MNKLKILFISAANSIHTVKWVNALSDEFEVHLAYCKNHNPNLDVINSKVILHELPVMSPFGYYLNVFEIRKIFKHIKPDMINVHYASGYGTLARLSNIHPVLLSIWGSDVYEFPHKSKLNKRILEKNVLYADEIASTSNAMAKELKRVVPNISKKIFITPFGVDVDKFKNQHINHKTINIGNIKTLSPVYAIEDGIFAIKKLRENLINHGSIDLANSINFFVYGNGPEKDKLEKIIKDEKLDKFVHLKGKIPNEKVPNALSELDIFCITSKKESFGVSVVEAMSCEIPVVATNVDGFKEVMEDGNTGYIVDVGNIDDIASKLEILVCDKELRKELGKNGRKKVMKEYIWKNNVGTMKNIYKRIMVSGKRRKK